MSVIKRIVFVLQEVFFIFFLAYIFSQSYNQFQSLTVTALGPIIGIGLLITGFSCLFSITKTDEHGSLGLSIVLWIIGLACISTWNVVADYDWFGFIAVLIALVYSIYLTFSHTRYFVLVSSWSDKKVLNILMKVGTGVFPICMLARIAYYGYIFITGKTLPAIYGTLSLILLIIALFFAALRFAVELKYRNWGVMKNKNKGVNSAPLYKVENAMRSLANYFSGGYSKCGSGTIEYSVSVDVSSSDDINVDVVFRVKCTLKGDVGEYPSIESKVGERLELIIKRAKEKLYSLDGTRNYNITAKVIE